MIRYVRAISYLALHFGGAQAFSVGRNHLVLNSVGVTDIVSSTSPPFPSQQITTRKQSLALYGSSASEEYSIDPSNVAFGLVWVALLGFTFFIAPGELQGSDYDQSILQAIIDNPQKPQVNELFTFVFNQFAVVPLALACVTLPQASKMGPPPIPFLFGSSFFGYFIFGPYMVLRGFPKEETNLQDLGWFTSNVLENKLFNAGALLLSLYFATQVSWSEFDPLSQGFEDMWSRSKLVSVSSVDLSILTLTVASLIPQDYRLRNPEDRDRANLIAGLTLLVPVYGALTYCLLRPRFPKD